MVQFIIGLILPFLLTLLKLLIKNPAVAAEEATVISEIAQFATQADTIVNGTVWTSTTGGTPAAINAAKVTAVATVKAKLGSA
jgi:glutamate 5-kinase